MNTKPRTFWTISVRTLLFVSIGASLLLALFWPRYGAPFPDCVGEPGNKVWIGVPTDQQVMTRFNQIYDGYDLKNPMITKSKIFEEVMPCNFINFNGHREIHWVRYRCDVYFSEDPPASLPVLFEYDHYHLNGSGCCWKE